MGFRLRLFEESCQLRLDFRGFESLREVWVVVYRWVGFDRCHSSPQSSPSYGFASSHIKSGLGDVVLECVECAPMREELKKL